MAGLKRSDKGKHHIPVEISFEIIDLRVKYPRWTMARMIKKLSQTGIWNGRFNCPDI
jgi:hypothetical protein